VARTPLLTTLEAALDPSGADSRGAGSPGEWRATRREALRTAGGAAAAASAWSALGCGSSSPTAPRIVVVGAGLAGLSCAHRLRQAGHVAEVHEAAGRLGGRCWTIRDYFAEDQIAEHGGELIDTDHTALRALVAELGLGLDNVIAAEKPGTTDVYYVDGREYPLARARADYEAIRPALRRDLAAAGYPTFYNHHTAAGARLDRMSIVAWVEANVPGGATSDLGRLLDLAYNIEFGGASADQSALNLLYLLGYSRPRRFQLFGPSNERFHVHGGNDLVVSRLAARLEGQITTDSRLVAIRRRSGGGYALGFDRGGATATVDADHVVLALPFTILRSSVDYSRAGFDVVKRTAISELGMGTNSKLQLQFTDRHWRALGSNGASFADTGYQSTWEVTRAQPGRAGILVDFTGGPIGDGFGTGTTPGRARRFLAQIEPVLPGLRSRWNGRAALNYWAGYPLTLGSYAYYRVGQMTRFAGAEREPSGRCHFAGEQTSYTYQGYLEGAVSSGERAAREVVAALRRSS
jgi:monoamine oxidase